jgi:hypothetical protein
VKETFRQFHRVQSPGLESFRRLEVTAGRERFFTLEAGGPGFRWGCYLSRLKIMPKPMSGGGGARRKRAMNPHAPRNSSPCECALLLERARNALGCLNHDCRRCFRSANKKRWKQEALAFGGVAI